ncbi:unknown [Clostridium sp. CAG:221]|nr:unknown [Clostridium sp. CAG:221]
MAIASPTIILKVKAFPRSFSAVGLFPFPKFRDMLAVAPIPISIPKAKIIVIIGIVIPTPVIAREPIFGILPINILSTILYRAFTTIPMMAGIEYCNNNFPIGASPRCF